eukprot:8945181-Pyramimonas_sp.AAC.1
MEDQDDDNEHHELTTASAHTNLPQKRPWEQQYTKHYCHTRPLPITVSGTLAPRSTATAALRVEWTIGSGRQKHHLPSAIFNGAGDRISAYEYYRT